MRGKDLLECIEQIDDALVEEAMDPAAVTHRNAHKNVHRNTHKYRSNRVVKWGMAAACVVVISVSAAALWTHQDIKNMQMDNAGVDTASPMTGNDAGSSDNTEGMADGLAAGAAAENVQADADEAGSGEAISGSLDICSLPRADENSGSGSDEAVSQGTASDGGNDTASQESMEDAVPGNESAAVRDMEKAETESEGKETAKLKYTVISDYYGEKDESVSDHPIPEKGEIICHHYLHETMKHYAELENTSGDIDTSIYAYDVVIDIYGDIEIDYEPLSLRGTNAGNEMIEQEYRRLEELGYDVRLSEDFQLTGTFTKMEIDTFQTLPEYGYSFRFANED